MKKGIFTAIMLAALLGACLPAGAEYQTTASRRAAIASGSYSGDVFVNPLGLLLGLGSVGYEGVLDDNHSWTIRGDFSGRSVSDYNYSSFGLTGSWRFFLAPDKPITGLFVGPTLGLYALNYAFNGASSSNTVLVGVGVEGGYQIIFDNGFVLTPGITASYLIGSVNAPSGAAYLPFQGLYPGLILNLGWAF